MYTQDFQLLEARTGDVRVELPWRKNTPYMNPRIFFSEASNVGGETSQHITAVIGKNGTGKSHLLTSIVQTFISLEEIQTGKRTSVANLALEFLSYRIDGRHCTVERKPHRTVDLKVDGRETDIFDFPLPKRVVALTISPFDKFPVPRLLRHSVAPADKSIYQYLGLRDRFYKASIDNLVFRSLNTLFEEDENEARRRANIGAVFEFLKLLPTLTVVYRIKISSGIRKALSSDRSLRSSGTLTNNDQRLRVEEMLRGGFDEHYLRDLLHMAIGRGERGVIRTTADFSKGGDVDETFKVLQPLRRAGFLKIAGVEVTQADGLVSDLKRASSGQLSMISSLLSLASVITDGSLVLIDEPELSLHPEWQTDYVELLMQTFSQFSGCHFVIATHSPLVISELPKHSNIIALDQSHLPPLGDIAGQSSDYLLAEVFGSPSPGNLYIRERVVTALRLAGNGEVHSDEFKQTLSNLLRLAVDLEETDPARKLIDDLAKVTAFAGKEANL